ncbi:MAG TPA: heme biosynthesis HemY N-terminal domain-containing protein, partial [Pseudidiomarina sp.]|nr:heme biosynthesis HemY N-terminal domain-containing protein [Pseudidiomarina sp.]
MKKGIALVIVLIAGLILGPLWAGNTGYVLISALGWTIELSLVAAIILLLLAVIIIRAVWRFLARIVRGTKWGMRWFGQRRETKAANAYQEGLNHLLSGDYRAASAAFN